MLLHLQEFSQKLLAHTHGIQDQVDGVIHEAKVGAVYCHCCRQTEVNTIICLSVCLSIWSLSVSRSVWCLSDVCLSVCLICVGLSVSLYVCLMSVCLSVCRSDVCLSDVCLLMKTLWNSGAMAKNDCGTFASLTWTLTVQPSKWVIEGPLTNISVFTWSKSAKITISVFSCPWTWPLTCKVIKCNVAVETTVEHFRLYLK